MVNSMIFKKTEKFCNLSAFSVAPQKTKFCFNVENSDLFHNLKSKLGKLVKP